MSILATPRRRSPWDQRGVGVVAMARALTLQRRPPRLLVARIKQEVVDTRQSMVNTIETILVALEGTDRHINVPAAAAAAVAVPTSSGASGAYTDEFRRITGLSNIE
mmetsp:Transcript_3441/g.11514  ORF Transcript_3441/g.11514 Transcript_3441/m.11514 type:complete len:107 (+) Transcript_3441:1008-1328(+)